VVGANGSGKSSFIDALVFALYGKAYRKINKPQLVNSINNKNLMVEVEFQIGPREYRVRRGIKPNIFEIYLDEALLDQDSSSKDYQENFEQNILKIGYRSFTQIVVLGSANHIPFMQLPAQGRREVVEDLLDIQIFSVMNTLLKERVQKNKDDLATNSMNTTIVDSKLEMVRKHIEAIKDNNNVFIKEKLQQKDTLSRTKQDIQGRIDGENVRRDKFLGNLLPELQRSKLYDKSAQLHDTRIRLVDEIKHLELQLGFFAEHNRCPQCKQSIDETFAREAIQKKQKHRDRCQEQLEKLNATYDKIGGYIQKVERIQEAIRTSQDKIDEMGVCIRQCDERSQTIEDEIENIRAKTIQRESDATDEQEYLGEKESLELVRQELMDDKELLTTAATLLKDGGIKTKIIKQYVPVMNKLISKYLAAMDFFVQFELDENFIEKILSRHRDEFSYESFSEGEKFRIDIALLFTWRAIAKLRNRAHCNLLILDEVFDGSLDAAGTEEFLKIIYALSEDTNVFMISHSHQVMSDRFERVIKFNKITNFTEVTGGVDAGIHSL